MTHPLRLEFHGVLVQFRVRKTLAIPVVRVWSKTLRGTPPLMKKLYLSQRLRAFSLHFLASLVVVGTVLLAMRLVWYPTPFTTLQGWANLLWVVVGVDIVLGPTLTFLVYSPGKKTLRFDLTVIVLVQISALAYGVYASALGRPIYLVFLADRFETVSPADYPQEEITAAKNSPFLSFPWLGPKPITATIPSDIKEKNAVTFSAAAGGGLKIMSRYYQPYATVAKTAITKGKNLSDIRRLKPQQAEILSKWILAEKRNPDDVVFVPLQGRLGYGLVMLDIKTGNIVSMEGIDPSWY